MQTLLTFIRLYEYCLIYFVPNKSGFLYLGSYISAKNCNQINVLKLEAKKKKELLLKLTISYYPNPAMEIVQLLSQFIQKTLHSNFQLVCYL